MLIFSTRFLFYLWPQEFLRATLYLPRWQTHWGKRARAGEREDLPRAGPGQGWEWDEAVQGCRKQGQDGAMAAESRPWKENLLISEDLTDELGPVESAVIQPCKRVLCVPLGEGPGRTSLKDQHRSAECVCGARAPARRPLLGTHPHFLQGPTGLQG